MDDLISRQAAIDLLKQMRKDGDMIPWEGKDVFARIRKLPSAEPEAAIVKVLKMVEEYKEKTGTDEIIIMPKNGMKAWDENGVEYTMQPTCNNLATDTISRKAAIALAKDLCVPTKDRTVYRHRCIDPDAIKELPSVQPEQRWIPVTERLPEEPYGCLVTVWDTNPITMDEFENILPYFVGWDGEQWNDADGEQCPFEVIAWMPLPDPYREDAT